MIYAIYVPYNHTPDQHDRFCMWQAKQWLAGRIESHDEPGKYGVTVFASATPFPSTAPSAHRIAS